MYLNGITWTLVTGHYVFVGYNLKTASQTNYKLTYSEANLFLHKDVSKYFYISQTDNIIRMSVTAVRLHCVQETGSCAKEIILDLHTFQAK